MFLFLNLFFVLLSPSLLPICYTHSSGYCYVEFEDSSSAVAVKVSFCLSDFSFSPIVVKVLFYSLRLSISRVCIYIFYHSTYATIMCTRAHMHSRVYKVALNGQPIEGRPCYIIFANEVVVCYKHRKLLMASPTTRFGNIFAVLLLRSLWLAYIAAGRNFVLLLVILLVSQRLVSIRQK